MTEDKVISVDEELGEAIVTTKSGQKMRFKTNTVTTKYASGRQDCTVQMLQCLGAATEQKPIGG